MLALLAGLWAGLSRLGWTLPIWQPNLLLAHGPLMVSGFLGSLIILERVVALRIKALYLAPLLTALGGLALILALPDPVGALLITLGSLGGSGVLGIMFTRERKPFTAAMFLGTLSWFTGNLLWLLGWPIFRVVVWWAAFLILTIAGERLELSRVLRPSGRQMHLFEGAAGLLVAGAILSTVLPEWGTRLAGAGMLALSLWLVAYDVARRTLGHPSPLTRFIALCLFLGHLWLGVAGLFDLLWGAQTAGLLYDAALHALFLGFVISMIFGHAPIILPGILRVPVAFHPVYYLHLVLLHLSLLVRIGSDLSSWYAGRRWAGLFNEIAVLLFLGVTVVVVRRSLRAVAIKGA